MTNLLTAVHCFPPCLQVYLPVPEPRDTDLLSTRHGAGHQPGPVKD
jgi:hypothetical protein